MQVLNKKLKISEMSFDACLIIGRLGRDRFQCNQSSVNEDSLQVTLMSASIGGVHSENSI